MDCEVMSWHDGTSDGQKIYELFCPQLYSDNKVSNLTIKFQTQASKGSQDQPAPEHNPTMPSPVIRKSPLHKYRLILTFYMSGPKLPYRTPIGERI
jgi:hypothetical protein